MASFLSMAAQKEDSKEQAEPMPEKVEEEMPEEVKTNEPLPVAKEENEEDSKPLEKEADEKIEEKTNLSPKEKAKPVNPYADVKDDTEVQNEGGERTALDSNSDEDEW
jgi:hypothetical protein